MPDERLVTIERTGHIATVTLDRPRVNAINRAMRDALERAFLELELDFDVYAIVLTGGPHLFSAGVDIHELTAAPPSDAVPRNRRFQTVYGLVEASRAPVIAAINGYALGGGCELAMACDIRIAAADASFGLPEINLGGVPGIGGPQRLARLVGESKAKQMVLTGQRIDGHEAHRLGLADELAPANGAIEAALRMAETIASKPPLSVQAAKRTIAIGRDLPLERAQNIDLIFVDQVAGTTDRAESLRAFVEKRSPHIEGR
ncbi:enoyl-CoA hydratase/isomerase family protein [bacterium]|nr:MAG: enoyl-CoA hydratase/isomerase family protein [bacterium]